MPRPIIDGDRRTYFPAPDAYVRLLRKVPGLHIYGADWPDAKTPRTDRPVRFYRAFTPGGNSRKYLYPSRIHA